VLKASRIPRVTMRVRTPDNTSGLKKSFQEKMNPSRLTVITPGHDSGTATRQKAPQRLQPSTSATMCGG